MRIPLTCHAGMKTTFMTKGKQICWNFYEDFNFLSEIRKRISRVKSNSRLC